MKVLPVMTVEQAALFQEAVQHMPGFLNIEWESADIDELNGKRFLCLQSAWYPGQKSPIYVHFHPDGCSESEMRTLTERHGLPCFTPVDHG